jgi:hypothetical protein
MVTRLGVWHDSGGVRIRSLRQILSLSGLPRCVKINAPEMGGGGQELYPNTDPLRSALSSEYDPAFLFFLCFWIYQHQHLVVVYFMLQYQQPAVGIYDQGFADLAKLLARVAAAEGLQLHPVKDALAAAICGKSCFLHSEPIIGLPPGTVNCPFGQVCPIIMLFGTATCKV